MKYVIIMALFGLAFGWSEVRAQSKKEKKGTERAQEAASSRDPGANTEAMVAKRKSTKKSGGTSFNAQSMAAYEKLKQENAKKYRKIERMKDDPQYADPSYFGHKKKPKKRKVGKRKYCKECGIVH